MIHDKKISLHMFIGNGNTLIPLILSHQPVPWGGMEDCGDRPRKLAVRKEIRSSY